MRIVVFRNIKAYIRIKVMKINVSMHSDIELTYILYIQPLMMMILILEKRLKRVTSQLNIMSAQWSSNKWYKL